MNMKPYQDFIETYAFIRKFWESNGFEAQIRGRMDLLKKKYAKAGITDEQVIFLRETSKYRQQAREMDLYLQTCHVFEIEDKHKYLLLLTKNPKTDEAELWKHVRLPFPEIFLDVEFDSDELEHCENKITGILLKEMKSISPVYTNFEGLKESHNKKEFVTLTTYGLMAYICGIASDGSPFTDKFLFPILNKSIEPDGEEGEVHGLKVNYDNKKEAEFVKRFIINFILFLKDREVIYITRERSQKNNERRLREGKTILPSSRIIKLTGQLKHYVNSLQDTDFKGKLSYKFWVSGHWRTYRAERYSVMRRNKVQWIEPYKKGQGIEVKHIYRIVPDDEEDTLNYDDIPTNKE